MLKIYAKFITINAFLYNLRYVYLISIFTITSILSYIVPMRDSFDISSLVIKLRAINDYIYFNNIEIYSFFIKLISRVFCLSIDIIFINIVSNSFM